LAESERRGLLSAGEGVGVSGGPVEGKWPCINDSGRLERRESSVTGEGEAVRGAKSQEKSVRVIFSDSESDFRSEGQRRLSFSCGSTG
jgi:hypothetical protein